MNSMHLICLMMLSSNDLSVASAHLKFDYFSLVIEGLFFLLIIFLRMKVACIEYHYFFFLFVSVDNDSSNAITAADSRSIVESPSVNFLFFDLEDDFSADFPALDISLDF